MNVKLTIENGKWCFSGLGSEGKRVTGEGYTMRDAMTNYNRSAGSVLHRPNLISSTIVREYEFTQDEFENLQVVDFERKLQTWRRLRSRLGLVQAEVA